MLRSIALLICLLLTKQMYSQQMINKQLSSTYLDTEREVSIYLPNNYELDSLKRYPLAIVLNKSLLLDNYIANANLFTIKDLAPKQIIVGINMDNTFIKDISFDRNNGSLSTTARNFYNFIHDEVIFFMESNYRVSPFISIIGEGYAANLITHFLSENSGVINALVCINPNFSQFIGQQLMSYNLDKFKKYDSKYYVYINNTNTFSNKKKFFIDEIQQGLANYSIENLTVIKDSISSSNSISALSEAIPRALSKIFEIYAPITKEEYESDIKDLAPLDAIAYVENKYIDIEFLFGSKLGIRERDIYAIENIIIEKENGDYLKDFGKMILKLYPSSPLGDYYLGRYYESGNMIKKALYHYKVGYGKMDPSDPNADAFYENILRVGGN